MKKHVYSLGLMLAATFTLTNCAQELDNPVYPGVEGAPFEILVSTPDTKTVNDRMATNWAEGDKLNVFHAVGENSEYKNNYAFEISDLEKGKFTGVLSETLDVEEEYNWFAFYPYDSHINTPANTNSGYMTVGSKAKESQTQNGNNSMAHIAGPNYPLSGFAIATPAKDVPVIPMSHVSSLLEINVTNNSDQPLNVTEVTFTAPDNIVGTYYIDFTKAIAPESFVGSGNDYVSKTAKLEVKDAEELASDESAKFYLAVKPFVAAAGEKLTINVNGYSKELSLEKLVEFSAGKIKKLNFSYDKKNEPEQPSSWILTDLAEIKAGDQVVIVSTKSGNSYALSNDKGTSAAPAAVKVTASNNILSDAPADNIVWHFDVANNQYTFYKDSGKSAWLYCTNSNNGVRVGTNTDKVFEIKDDYLYHVVQKRYLGVYNAQDWRCYTSINTNITEQALQFYVKTIGVETPDVPKIPELQVTAEVEVDAAGGNAEFDYIVLNSVDGVSVSASTTENWISNFNYDTPNKVKFTVAENYLEEPREADITLIYDGAESKTVKVKQAAKIPEGMTVDDLTLSTTGIKSNAGYSEWSGKTATSSAVYAGNSAGGNNSIQMRSDNDNSGIVTTTSGGYAKKVVVTWNSNTGDARTLNIYGKNTAYTAATDLYDTAKQGTLLGTIKKGTSTEFVIPGNYQYIGLRSASGAMYITEIQITWSSSPIALESIAVSGQKTEYYVGDSFVAPTVTATYSDGSLSVVSGAEFSGYDMSQEGEQTVTVSYTLGDVTKETTYIINVKAKPALVSIAIDGTPKTEYTVGDSFVAPSVKATYSDGLKQTVAAKFSGYDMSKEGEQTVTVSYTEGDITAETTYKIVVKAAPSGPVEKSATLSFANKAQRTSFSTSKQVWEQNGITFTNDKSSSTNNVADYANPVRLYANSKVTVEAPGNITKIVFDANSSSYATAMKNSIGTVSGATVSVSSDKVTVTFANATASSFVVAKLTAQVRMDSITVTYLQ